MFHIAECRYHIFAEHILVEFRADQPVAVFAGMRSFVFTNHLERGFGDIAELFGTNVRF